MPYVCIDVCLYVCMYITPKLINNAVESSVSAEKRVEKEKENDAKIKKQLTRTHYKNSMRRIEECNKKYQHMKERMYQLTYLTQ